MNFERRPPIADKHRAAEGDSADGPPKAKEGAHQIAARIAQAFRGAGVSTELLDPAPTVTAFGTLLRRDRLIVALALALLTAMTWSYLLWLSADMGMGDMDMSGFRMIPSSMGLMVPAQTPWRATEFAFVFAMWTVMMVGMMTPSATPMIFMHARVGRHAEAQSTPLLALLGLLLAISLYGLLSHCSPPWCNGYSSVPICSMPRWQAQAMSSEDRCS